MADKRNTYDLFGPVNKLWSANYDRAMMCFMGCLQEFGAYAKVSSVFGRIILKGLEMVLKICRNCENVKYCKEICFLMPNLYEFSHKSNIARITTTVLSGKDIRSK